jgi:hypothetical protein
LECKRRKKELREWIEALKNGSKIKVIKRREWRKKFGKYWSSLIE